MTLFAKPGYHLDPFFRGQSPKRLPISPVGLVEVAEDTDNLLHTFSLG